MTTEKREELIEAADWILGRLGVDANDPRLKGVHAGVAGNILGSPRQKTMLRDNRVGPPLRQAGKRRL